MFVRIQSWRILEQIWKRKSGVIVKVRAVGKVGVAAECVLIREGGQCFTTDALESCRPASVYSYSLLN